MKKQIVSLSLLLPLSLSCAFAQNLFLNGSFEDASSASIPSHWEKDDQSGVNASRSYITSGGAQDGTDFLRITANQVSSSMYYSGFDSVEATNSPISPNCRYRLSYYYYGSDLGMSPHVSIDRGWGAGWGNSAIEGYSIGYFDDYVPSFQLVSGTWTERSFEFTTSPEGIWNIGWYPQFDASGDSFDGAQVGSTLDYDNVRLELLEAYLSATLNVSSGYTYSYSNTDVLIQFHSVTTQDHTVEMIPSLPTTKATANFLPRYWVIDQPTGAFSATVTFNYTDAELAASGILESNLHLLKRETSNDAWVEVASTVDSVANQISTQNPVSDFSEWAISDSSTSINDWALY